MPSAISLTTDRLQGDISGRMAIKKKVLIRRANDGVLDCPRETSFYFFSTDISAEKAAEPIHSHRGVENRNHNIRDRAMQENACRIRTNPGIFARTHRFAPNILRANRKNNIANAPWGNTLDIKRVLKYRFR
jgi:predicted transposase YbfD/YdcC